jgi:L-alanine-DL-glutamate epimerase-like enolase superfamily enzyme
MKIISIETLRTEEFANVVWVRIHADTGLIGLGETFYGAGAVEAQIRDTLASRPPGHAQSSDGAVIHRRRISRSLRDRTPS